MGTTTTPTWEYKVMNTGMFRNVTADSLQKTFNKLGAEGWELAGTVHEPASALMRKDVTQFIFKRRRG